MDENRILTPEQKLHMSMVMNVALADKASKVDVRSLILGFGFAILASFLTVNKIVVLVGLIMVIVSGSLLFVRRKAFTDAYKEAVTRSYE